MSASLETVGPGGGPREFTTTHWSVVLTAGHGTSTEAGAALEQLCRAYWYPLYAYVRRRGYDASEAQDLTQEFFARFLEKQYFKLADPARGLFRTFLLTSLRHFLINEWRRVSRVKRGSGQVLLTLDANEAEGRYALEPADESSPDKLYERRWAAILLEQTMRRLSDEYGAGGRGPLFEELKAFIWGDQEPPSQADVAARLGISEGAVQVAVHRLRRRCRELLRQEIAQTVSSAEAVEEEMRHLKEVLCA